MFTCLNKKFEVNCGWAEEDMVRWMEFAKAKPVLPRTGFLWKNMFWKVLNGLITEMDRLIVTNSVITLSKQRRSLQVQRVFTIVWRSVCTEVQSTIRYVLGYIKLFHLCDHKCNLSIFQGKLCKTFVSCKFIGLWNLQYVDGYRNRHVITRLEPILI